MIDILQGKIKKFLHLQFDAKMLYCYQQKEDPNEEHQTPPFIPEL